jgi:DNA-binding transcriptional regulator YiaG
MENKSETENLKRKFDFCLETLTRRYDCLEPMERVELVGTLEKFIATTLTGGKVELVETPGESYKMLVRQPSRVKLSEKELKSPYSGETAKKVREQLGLSPAELAAKLGLSVPTISRYEAGRIHLKNTARITTNNYLKWLKDTSGYNPFNI